MTELDKEEIKKIIRRCVSELESVQESLAYLEEML